MPPAHSSTRSSGTIPSAAAASSARARGVGRRISTPSSSRSVGASTARVTRARRASCRHISTTRMPGPAMERPTTSLETTSTAGPDAATTSPVGQSRTRNCRGAALAVGSTAMRQRLTDSFDHYSRYRYVIELRDTAFGSEPIRLLDVGDPFGHVGELFPGDDTVSVDLFTEGPGPPGHRRLIGSGLELPFPDGSFDLVVSHDTYEHIPDDLRRGFVEELLRVGRGPVLVVAPFADPRTELCERLVGGYFVARTGRPLPPLEEHRACGLPSLAGLLEYTRRLGVGADGYGDLWLDQWLGLWLVRCHLVGDRSTEPLIPLPDAAVNGAADGERRRGPHYRRVVLLRPGDAPGFDLPRPQEPADPAADLARLQELYLQMVEVLRGRDDPL